MNRKGITPITVFFWLIAFGVVYALALAPMMNSFAQAGIADYNLTGLPAFILANMNIWIVILVFVFILAIQFWGNTE